MAVIQSSSLEYTHQEIPVVSQPSSTCITIVSDVLTTLSSSPATTTNPVDYLTTSSNSVVTSISEQGISTITATAGTYIYMYLSLIITYIITVK